MEGNEIFDFASLKRGASISAEEKQKLLATLAERARSYLPETEKTAKYLNALIEYKRLQLGLTVEEYAPLLGFSTSAYQKAYLQPNTRFGSYSFSCLAQFCYLFGYDLDVPKEASAPETVADLYAQELAAFLISLGPDAMDDISRAIINSDHVGAKVKPIAGRLFSKSKKVFYGDNGKPVLDKLNYNSYISEAQNQLKALDKSAPVQPET